MSNQSIEIKLNKSILRAPVKANHTIVVGSGAAGLNAAVQLQSAGVTDLAIITEGLAMGTSINTGSDKQTYYKLGMCGSQDDSPEALAESFFAGGSMHGDLALTEASLSARAFLNLVNLGVQFPRDAFGQFVGYKTDHDPRQRATSFGPYTSREMCRVLIDEVRRREITVHEDRVVVSLLTIGKGTSKRAAGVVTIRTDAKTTETAFEVFIAENVVFATGGPGGIYKTSVYPSVHTGAIGVALRAGARAQSLPESQYGMASTKFRWNVSGTYMQVIPRFISTADDGAGDEQEFLRPWFKSSGEMNSAVFLKGYQWPFDPRKVVGGSSIVDILVYIETVIKKRRVFLDYRSNPVDFDFDQLSSEAHEYLKKSDALFGTPIERLAKMNQPAIDLYKDHDIDITREPLEIAVCAQHNNGGLAGNLWWESLNIKHLFPIGEVNGSHGVYRPGGTALNSGQVAGFRVAEYISRIYDKGDLDARAAVNAARLTLGEIAEQVNKGLRATTSWTEARDEFQHRMSEAGAHVRSAQKLEQALEQARHRLAQLEQDGQKATTVEELTESLRNLQLCSAHVAYLDATLFAVKSGIGSRGSAIVLGEQGTKAHDDLDESWRFVDEDESYREKVLETTLKPDGTCENTWVPRRALPHTDPWFETAWAEFREGKIYYD